MTMTTRTALGARIDRTSASSAKRAGVRAFRGGLSSRTKAMLPSITVSTSCRRSGIVPTDALQQGAGGVVATAEAFLQGGKPRLQQRRIELAEPVQGPLVRADDLAQDGVDLVALAQLLGDAAQILVDEAQPDPLRDVLRRPRRGDAASRQQGAQERVHAAAEVPIEEDAALALPSEVPLGAQHPEDAPGVAVVGDQRRTGPGQDVERDVDADEIEHRQ